VLVVAGKNFSGFLVFFLLAASSLQSLSHDRVIQLKRAVVTINVRASQSAMGAVGHWSGTGFLVDLRKGLIFTNRHVAAPGSVATYEVTFWDGQKARARLVYWDACYDFACLKINPQKAPHFVHALSTFRDPRMGEQVNIMGNNEGQSFSLQTGHVRSLFDDAGFFPQPAFGYLTNTYGGSSGSPVVNDKLDILGINYAGNKSGFGYAIYGSYLKHILDALRRDQLPKRFSIGVIMRLRSLHEAIKYYNFPESVARTYVKTYPQAGARILMVSGTLPGSPAVDVLKEGDIVVAINNHPVGPDRRVIDNTLDKAWPSPVRLTLYRQGRKQTVSLEPYDLESIKIKRLLIFAGCTFFEVNDEMRLQFGLKPGSLLTLRAEEGSAFSSAPGNSGLEGAAFLGATVPEMTFDSFSKHIPTWIQKRYFTIPICFLFPVSTGFAGIHLSSRRLFNINVSYLPYENSPPTLLVWSDKDHQWNRKTISLKRGP
jgi:S1-C subfamily serine protease